MVNEYGENSNRNLISKSTLENLEKLVSSMESGELSLEDSLKAFETGIKLTRECQTALKGGAKVQILVNEEGDMKMPSWKMKFSMKC